MLATSLFMAADTAEQLLGQYQTLKTTLQNQRGFTPGDKETTRKLRDQMAAVNTNHENFQLVAAELQMSIWLEDKEQCNTLFQELSTLQPSNLSIALAWADYSCQEMGADADVVYEELAERFPNSPEIILNWARSLEAKNQFTKAIETNFHQVTLKKGSWLNNLYKKKQLKVRKTSFKLRKNS